MKLILTTLSTGLPEKVLAHVEEPLMTDRGLIDPKTAYEIGIRVAEYANRTKLAKLDSSSGKGLLALWAKSTSLNNVSEENIQRSMHSVESSVTMLTNILDNVLVQNKTRQQDYSCTLIINQVKIQIEIKDINTTVEQLSEEIDVRNHAAKNIKDELNSIVSKNISFGFRE